MKEEVGIDKVIESIEKRIDRVQDGKTGDIVIIHERQKRVILELVEALKVALEEMNMLPWIFDFKSHTSSCR